MQITQWKTNCMYGLALHVNYSKCNIHKINSNMQKTSYFDPNREYRQQNTKRIHYRHYKNNSHYHDSR